ncbi:MAG: PorT family protein [Muribaculaceae bacterium]|nr:PorT family protein [Muribaculaceae bacterium]
MKRIFLILAMIIVMSCQSVKAQTPIDPNADYNRITLMYQYRDLGGDGTNGFEIGYIHGFALSRNTPLFFQTGLKMDMGFESESASESGLKMSGSLTTMSFNVPLDIAYKLVFGENSNVAFIPFAGFNLKLNALAKLSAKASYNGQHESESISLFDDEIGMKRFQAGWHIGFGFQINKFYAGADFGTDFIKIADYGNHTPTFHLGIGYTF